MANTSLTRTSGTSTNVDKCTFSAWVKRGNTSGSDHILMAQYTDANNRGKILISDNQLAYFQKTGGSTTANAKATRQFRDTSAWYHIVLAFDSTQSTAEDRIKFYVNGVQETVFSNEDYGAQNENVRINESSVPIFIGQDGASGAYFDGIMSHVHFCDGYVYAASDFGSTDSTTGEWEINTSPSVTYGTNGFAILKDGNTITDQSSNSNNFSLVGGTLTKTEDCPNNVFATMNQLDNYYSNMTFSQGGNTVVSDHPAPSVSTLGMTSGKYYFEGKALSTTGGSDWQIGIISTQITATSHEIGHHSNDYGYYGANGNHITGNSGTSYGNTYTTGDIIGCAVDLTNNKLYFSKNGTWQNSGVPTSGGTGTGAISITAPASTSLGVYLVAVGAHASANSYTWNMNFGNGYFGTTAVSSAGSNASNNGIFEYDVPTGYTALSTKGLNL